MRKLLRIDARDNVLVVRNQISPGDEEEIDGVKVIFKQEVTFGQKISSKEIKKGENVIKFGRSIGSATEDILLGEHVHLHNLKSDYISTYTLDNEFIKSN